METVQVHSRAHSGDHFKERMVYLKTKGCGLYKHGHEIVLKMNFVFMLIGPVELSNPCQGVDNQFAVVQ